MGFCSNTNFKKGAIGPQSPLGLFPLTKENESSSNMQKLAETESLFCRWKISSTLFLFQCHQPLGYTASLYYSAYYISYASHKYSIELCYICLCITRLQLIIALFKLLVEFIYSRFK